jgi:hypothetical protein
MRIESRIKDGKIKTSSLRSLRLLSGLCGKKKSNRKER